MVQEPRKRFRGYERVVVMRLGFGTDVTQSADVRRMVQSAVQQHGGLDYAFNNAGFVGSTAGIVDTTEEEWHQAVALNLTSVWLCM